MLPARELLPVKGCDVCLRLALDLADAKAAMNGGRVADIAPRFRRHLKEPHEAT
ncbi:hypothetical protein [Streptomyces sp. ODS28]|uniref:hypothetical protein n=1 Tax=Streptomyces sp. ODS28 TaxID=3136688 RepID=UPI0031E703CF